MITALRHRLSHSRLHTETGQMMRTMYDFQAEGPNEISLRKGDVVQRQGEPIDGWVKVKKGSLVGFAPVTYLMPVGSAPSVPVRAVPPPSTTTQTSTIAKPSISDLPSIAIVGGPNAHLLVSQPSAPPPPTPMLAPEPLAVEKAECLICYENMHEQPAAALADTSGKRVCPHFIHQTCLEGWLQSKGGRASCPACRTPFTRVLPVPSYETDPRGFFKVCDFSGDGRLNQGEVLAVVKAVLPCDYRALEDDIHNWWALWDKDGSGELSFEEMCGKDGLLDYLRTRFHIATKAEPPPFSRSTREAWFAYWDDSGDGSLQQEELVRALVKTFQIGTDHRKLAELRETVATIWPVFDTDGSGSVDKREFLAPDGLADSLQANITWVQSHRQLTSR